MELGLTDDARKKAGFVDDTCISIIASKKLSKRNKSGIKGVYFDNREQRWIAKLNLQGKEHYLGQYENIIEAIKARHTAEEEYFKPIIEKYQQEGAKP
jgi:hypothetical protein